ncbi:post-GPI attachment to proteins factor 4-like [Artemia franciscana]|uniref:post-GPI attachment to proteins factor 4-like n=1 Tax=Artemia franciscana TaxID=6661 RepID=UPI0032DBDF1E
MRTFQYSYFYWKIYDSYNFGKNLVNSGIRTEHAFQYFHSQDEEILLCDEPKLVLTITATNRNKISKNYYLTQVAKEIHFQLTQCGERCHNIIPIICDASGEFNEEVDYLSRFFHKVEINSKNQNGNIFEKEKRDYINCLSEALKYSPEFILQLQDDALPKPGLFDYINYLMMSSHVKKALYVKLYHPERLQNYFQPEPARWLEWTGISFLISFSYNAFYYYKSGRTCTRNWISLFLLSAIALELIGRPYLIELRRVHPSLLSLAPASECCAPAMLYPRDGALRTANLLSESVSSKVNPFDIALYHLMRKTKASAYVIEPNLVEHIGFVSSIRTWAH